MSQTSSCGPFPGHAHAWFPWLSSSHCGMSDTLKPRPFLPRCPVISALSCLSSYHLFSCHSYFFIIFLNNMISTNKYIPVICYKAQSYNPYIFPDSGTRKLIACTTPRSSQSHLPRLHPCILGGTMPSFFPFFKVVLSRVFPKNMSFFCLFVNGVTNWCHTV